MEFKKDVVKYAKENLNNSAAEKFEKERKRVLEWVRNDNKLLPIKGSRCKFDNGRQKLTYV